ncbi:MAG TPA: efflux RND transporter periplasmic adaptor subunit [Candidatus Eisenbacteria bacterium]|nr:efflux RND transporter periplasmic adaptor subunit [Candidatus Eisenbacteria bacterium]
MPATSRPFHLPGLRPAALAALAFAAGACAHAQAPRAARVPVTVARAERRPTPDEIATVGTVEALRSATVHPQVGGLVTAIRFTPGVEVREGQPLFEIDRRPLEAALLKARGDLASARAAAQLARVEADRAQTLHAQQLISQSEYDQKRAADAAARAAVMSDSAAVATARLDLSFATVRAPISGRAGDRLVHEGDLMKADATDQAMVQINQIHPILVRFTLPQGDLPRLRHEDVRSLHVRARPAGASGAMLEGRLEFVDNQVDASTGTVLLKARFANDDGRLWPGQSVDVQLELSVDPNALVVPAVAITASQNGAFVFVVGDDSTVTMRPVKVAHTAGDVAVIAQGLEPGETVVTDGQFRLAPGSRVQIVPNRGVPGAEEAGGGTVSPPAAAAAPDPAAAAPAKGGGGRAGHGSARR